MREHWKYIGCETPTNLLPYLDGRPCYIFRLDLPDGLCKMMVVPRDEYWSNTLPEDVERADFRINPAGSIARELAKIGGPW